MLGIDLGLDLTFEQDVAESGFGMMASEKMLRGKNQSANSRRSVR